LPAFFKIENVWKIEKKTLKTQKREQNKKRKKRFYIYEQYRTVPRNWRAVLWDSGRAPVDPRRFDASANPGTAAPLARTSLSRKSLLDPNVASPSDRN